MINLKEKHFEREHGGGEKWFSLLNFAGGDESPY